MPDKNWGMTETGWAFWLFACRDSVAHFKATGDFAGEQVWRRTLEMAERQYEEWKRERGGR